MRQFLPEPTIVSKPFWDGCRDGKLMLQRCGGCDRHLFYPVYMCPHCMSKELEWTQTSGRGSIYSLTVVERQSGTQDDPRLVALIQLDEGPVMMSNVEADDLGAVAIGDRVKVTFEVASGDITLPIFVPDLGAE